MLSQVKGELVSLELEEKPLPMSVEVLLPLAKKTHHQNLGIIVSSFIRVFPYSPLQLSGFYSFPINALTETVDTPMHYNSSRYRMRFWVWFSSVSAAAIGDKGRLQGTHRSFQVICAALELGIWILESILIFPHFVQQH